MASAPLEALREILLELKPTGNDGFEGLVATALANLSGLTIRLSNSGSQFGRDGKSQAGAFAIALEAKRYKDKVPLQELAGKTSLAAFALSGDIDVWVLCATVEVGEGIEGDLRKILEKEGITLLALDWTADALPRLAVLIGAAKSSVLTWFNNNVAAVSVTDLEAHLNAIIGSAEFGARVDTLLNELTAATVGLDALREKNQAWLGLRFQDKDRSQESFGQFILVTAASRPAIDRPGVETALKAALEADNDNLIAVLGEEGTGKTWITTKIWSQLPQKPILVLVSGRRASDLNVKDPRGSLARLLAEQDDNLSDANVERWRRRLDRWASGTALKPRRFILLFDGVNEHANLPWADLLKKMSRLVRELGGKIIVTSRPGFWRRDIAPRVGGAPQVTEVPIGDYTPPELETVLARDAPTVTVATLPTSLKSFILNPRICAVAIGLLDSLKAQAEDLTRERLLIEYWRHRLEERGNLLSHNLADFDKLLRSHAKAWLESRSDFDRDNWADHSGAAKRIDPKVIVDDLTEIDEGRFLNLTYEDGQHYSFRQESLPYALGLLIIEELKSFVQKHPGSGPRMDFEILEQLEQIIQPVQAWDITSGVLAAAICLAFFDPTVSDSIKITLTRAWFELQNVDDDDYRLVMASSVAKPDIILDVVEQSLPGQLGVRRRATLTGLLVYKRDHPSVRQALEKRLPRWLSGWTREAEPIGNAKDNKERQAKRDATIDPSLQGLKSAELALFRELTNEQAGLPAVRLTDVAASLMASRPLTPFTAGLVGWALVLELAPDLRNVRSRLAWVLRLNRCDRAAMNAALRAFTARVGDAPSRPVAAALSEIFYLQGDPDLAALAQDYRSLEARATGRVSRYFEVDPFNPAATLIEDGNAVRERLADLPPDRLWCSMSVTSEDDTLKELTPFLARFDSQPLFAKIEEVVESGKSREQLPLRQLGWHLPEVSAALTPKGLTALQQIFDDLAANPDRVAEGDRKWTPGQIVEALNPHLSPQAQIALLQKLPKDYPLYLNLKDGMRPLSADALADFLETTEGRNKRCVLFHATGSKPQLNARSRAALTDLFFSEDDTLAPLAAEIVVQSDDDLYFTAILDRLAGTGHDEPATHIQSYAHDAAIGIALRALKRNDPTPLPPVRHSGLLCAVLGGNYLEQFVAVIDSSLDRLLKPSPVAVPADIVMHGSVNTDGSGASRWAEERELPDEDTEDDPFKKLQAFTDPDSHIKFGTRQKEIRDTYKAYVAEIRAADIEDISNTPELAGWDRIVAECPDCVLAWARKISAVSDTKLKSQVRNLAIVVARAVSFLEPVLSAELFRTFQNIEPPVTLHINAPKVAVFDFCLFGSANVSALQRHKTMQFFEAMTDAEIERLVVACEHSNSTGWLDGFVSDLMASGQTPDIALALTISGLRTPNSLSDDLLGQPRKPGFLGAVQVAAEEAYTRAKWSDHWFNEACHSLTAADLWRNFVLAAGIVDSRYLVWPEPHLASNSMMAFLDGIYSMLEKGANKRTKEREKTLFGCRAPEDDLRLTLADIRLPASEGPREDA